MEEYFDGELNEQQTEVIDTHLMICQSCSKEYKTLQAEQKVYSNYERNLVINPALQPLIEAKLAEYLNGNS
jgi:predicted anti-sigma-YlaC factor YlaD